MRKYLVGFIAGLLLASAFPVYGAVTSMVGKTVQAEHIVLVNGQELEVKAINIDGTTYSPNRAIADALGLGIGFSDGTVIFEHEEVDIVDVPITIPSQDVQEENSVESELDLINKSLAEIDRLMTEYLDKNAQLQFELMAHPENKGEIEQKIKNNDDSMKPVATERDRLQERKKELESLLQETGE